MMNAMGVTSQASPDHRSQRWATAALAVAAVLAVSACGEGDGEPQAGAAAPATVAPTTTLAPATSGPTTTIPSTTTTPTTPTSSVATTTTLPTISTSPPSTTTTSTTTTLVVQAPVQRRPVPPPADEHAREPVIEVGSIAIPRLDVDMTMYEGIRLSTLEHGPGHWPGTALPGELGNVVVGGHRTSGHQVFRNVDQLVTGDEIIFRDEAGEHTYLVDRVEVVDPSAVWIVDPTETATATLFACHPPGSTAQRIVVFADLADSAAG